jgi:hypothetical protein
MSHIQQGVRLVAQVVGRMIHEAMPEVGEHQLSSTS